MDEENKQPRGGVSKSFIFSIIIVIGIIALIAYLIFSNTNTAQTLKPEQFATYLRNEPTWKDEIIYWGPMGCLTGFYLILKGNRTPQDIYSLLLDAFKSVENTEEVPGATAVNCGYYRMHNLELAKYYAKEFVDYLVANKGNSNIFEYPKTERLKTDDGQHFFDS